MQGERERLGDALIARADDIADAVQARVWPGGTADIDPTAVRAIADADRASTRMIGNWLVGGQHIDEDDRRKLSELGRMIDRLSLGELTKAYLAWRDALLAVMYEEAVRLGTPPELVAEVATVIARNNDGSIVRMARRFDEERRRLHEVLARQATYDALTGLPNRTLLFDRIGHALTVSRRTGRELALLFVDLDGFKGVNDQLGHQAGDDLLIEVAKRLSDVVREADTVARLGGDEFVVLCEDLEGGQNPAEIAGRVVEAIERPVTLASGATVSVSASIGIGHAEPGDTASELLVRADGAMYAAKQGGRGRYESAARPDAVPA
jgi:diguanylate cyclase (GGDEF)-like protein